MDRLAAVPDLATRLKSETLYRMFAALLVVIAGVLRLHTTRTHPSHRSPVGHS